MDIPSTRFVQWYQRCPTYADLAFSGKVLASDLIYENSLNFVLARYMTLQAKQVKHSRALLNKLLISVMRGQESSLVSKALRALDGMLVHVSRLLRKGTGGSKRVAGFNMPLYYVGDGHPIYINIDLLLADTLVRLQERNNNSIDRRVASEKHGGIRIIIYHLDPDNEPTRSWILYNPRVMGAVCLASDLKTSYDTAVDIVSPYKKMLYRTDLTESYVEECRTQLHHLGRIISYGILGKTPTEACYLCVCRKECEQRGISGKANVRTVSKIPYRADGRNHPVNDKPA